MTETVHEKTDDELVDHIARHYAAAFLAEDARAFADFETTLNRHVKAAEREAAVTP